MIMSRHVQWPGIRAFTCHITWCTYHRPHSLYTPTPYPRSSLRVHEGTTKITYIPSPAYPLRVPSSPYVSPHAGSLEKLGPLVDPVDGSCMFGIHYRGCSGRRVQWMGVVLYSKLVHNSIQHTKPCFHCTPLWWILTCPSIPGAWVASKPPMVMRFAHRGSLISCTTILREAHVMRTHNPTGIKTTYPLNATSLCTSTLRLPQPHPACYIYIYIYTHVCIYIYICIHMLHI